MNTMRKRKKGNSGKLSKEKRKIANSLFKEGDSIEKVARILCESEETIRGWVNEKMDIKVE